MNKVMEFPVTRTYQRYMCTKCEYDLFEVADAGGKLIAVCAECQTPTTTLDCPCVTLNEGIENG
jgi:hypothetical protein